MQTRSCYNGNAMCTREIANINVVWKVKSGHYLKKGNARFTKNVHTRVHKMSCLVDNFLCTILVSLAFFFEECDAGLYWVNMLY